MTIGFVGTDHTRASLGVRGRLALDGARGERLLDLLAADPLIDEAAVLATCNRVEVYVAASDVAAAMDRATAHLAAATGMPAGGAGPPRRIWPPQPGCRRPSLAPCWRAMWTPRRRDTCSPSPRACARWSWAMHRS